MIANAKPSEVFRTRVASSSSRMHGSIVPPLLPLDVHQPFRFGNAGLTVPMNPRAMAGAYLPGGCSLLGHTQHREAKQPTVLCRVVQSLSVIISTSATH